MDTKLTLKLDKGIIEQAKLYAKENEISLSNLIENYLEALTTTYKKDIKISPLVKSLTGVIKLDENEDYKKLYATYIEEKYK